MEIGKQFRETKEEELGRWFEFGDARLLIASLRSAKFREAIALRCKPYRAQARRGMLPSDVLDSITTEELANHILLAWEGITENGKTVKYSREAALRFLKEFPKFNELVLEFAGNEAAFIDELEEEGIENLKNG
jgi:hypothetical protein